MNSLTRHIVAALIAIFVVVFIIFLIHQLVEGPISHVAGSKIIGPLELAIITIVLAAYIQCEAFHYIKFVVELFSNPASADPPDLKMGNILLIVGISVLSGVFLYIVPS